MKKVLIKFSLAALMAVFSPALGGNEEYLYPEPKPTVFSRLAPAPYHWYAGGGVLTSDIPIIKARLTFLMSELLGEYTVGNPNAKYRLALGGGLYGLGLVFPVPVLQPSFYIGGENGMAMGRLSVGAFSDVIVGGHSGVLFSAGVVVANRFDFSAVIVPFGTQPVRPYDELFGEVKEEFFPVDEVAYSKDPNGKPLVRYDLKHFHQKDSRFDLTSTYYYSSYDIAYGNGEIRNHKAYPDDFDYIEGRDYINFPYYGFLIGIRF